MGGSDLDSALALIVIRIAHNELYDQVIAPILRVSYRLQLFASVCYTGLAIQTRWGYIVTITKVATHQDAITSHFQCRVFLT